MPRNENKNSGLALQIKSICQLECCLQRFGVEKCLVIGFSEMAFLHWKQVLRVQFQHRIWLSWFFLRFFCLQKGQRIRFIFSSGFAARATSISTTICQKKNREEDLNKGEYRYLKCTRPCGFFFPYHHHINLFTTVSIKAYIFNEDMKMRWIQIFLAINCLIIH